MRRYAGKMHRYGLVDRVLIEADQALRVLCGHAAPARPTPGRSDEETSMLSATERKLAGRLMRINYAGEVSAQGLYQGQALTARDASVRERMRQSAAEENDHLAWCGERIRELGGRRSYLDPFWYFGSFFLGIAAGAAGDPWSLGFVTETENQVVDHIDDHLRRLPAQDGKSRAILEQMRIDEARHAHAAMSAGASALPRPVKLAMGVMSRVMTRGAYWI